MDHSGAIKIIWPPPISISSMSIPAPSHSQAQASATTMARLPSTTARSRRSAAKNQSAVIAGVPGSGLRDWFSSGKEAMEHAAEQAGSPGARKPISCPPYAGRGRRWAAKDILKREGAPHENPLFQRLQARRAEG